MVRTSALVLFLMIGSQAQALFGRTAQDLRALQDRLQYEFGGSRDRRADRDPNVVVTPILVAPPYAYWEDSKEDFAPQVMETLSHVFTNPGDMISCSQCFENRMYMAGDQRTVTQTGELSLTDLARLRQNPAYAAAKSVLIIRESPSGIAVRLIAAEDGRILYAGMVDSTKNLSDAEPPLRLARELDRRMRGESLTYINFDIGFYPNALLQLKFLEQWGSRNQHMSGFVISGFNPNGALGVNYTYMLPFLGRRMTAGGTVFYKLENMFKAKTDTQDNTTNSDIVGQLTINYAFSGAYGMFISTNSDGLVSIGVSLMNPVLFPFLL